VEVYPLKGKTWGEQKCGRLGGDKARMTDKMRGGF